MAKEFKFSFPGIRSAVMAARFPVGTSAEEKELVFQNLVRVLLNKSVVKPDGSVYNWRSGCLDYLLDVIPRLEEEEIHLILTDKEDFYRRFCFTPSKRMSSLYSELKRNGAVDRYKNIPVVDILQQFYEETELSPYELPEERTVVAMFLDNIEEHALFSLE